MGSIRPSGYPEWASDTPSGITEPTYAKKRIGWVTNEKPPAQYMNWLQEKQSSWIKYLSYDWVIDEDFIQPGRSTVYVSQETATLLAYAGWGMSGPANKILYAEDPVLGSLGNVRIAANASGFTVVLEKYAGNPGRVKDVCFEALVAPKSNNGGSAAGIPAPYKIGAYNGEAYFSATGSTGPGIYYFHWSASLGATMASLGITETPSAYQRLAFERVGQTMLVEINGQSRLAFYAGNVNFTGTAIGVFAGTAASGLGIIDMDCIRFGVRRT